MFPSESVCVGEWGGGWGEGSLRETKHLKEKREKCTRDRQRQRERGSVLQRERDALPLPDGLGRHARQSYNLHFEGNQLSRLYARNKER